MSNKKDGIKTKLKRELVRAILERTQSMDMSSLMPESEKLNAINYDNVEENLNIPYINREEVPLAMDIFKPTDLGEKELPVIVLIHGGGFTLGDRSISRPFGRLLAHKGYLVFSVEYRLAPRATICQELDDVCAGLDLIGTKLVDYNIDFNRIFMIAESAGAYLATYVAAMHGSEKLQHAIGYKASRLNFKAIGLNSGILYTNRKDPCGWMLAEQIYGEKRTDKNFLQYMDPEHPEIINNLPPAFLTTSSGDFVSNYTLMFHKALKKKGKDTRLIYYQDDDLMHAFNVLQPYHPKSTESLDKMLKWFDKEAAIQVKRQKVSEESKKKLAKIESRTADGSINEQKIWQYVKECNSVNEQRLNAVAVIDGTREYTYEQMFKKWERYARVFSGLGICKANKSRAAVCGSICAEPLFCFYALNMTGVTVSMLSYPDFLPTGNWKAMLKQEKITDLIISDIMVTPQLWRQISSAKEELGLKNIILIHSRLGGPSIGPGELIFNEFNYQALKRLSGTVFMDDLLKKYKTTPIRYSRTKGNDIAVITHTSGTTKGIRKPLPYTDKAVNIKTTKQKNVPRQITKTKGNQQVRIALEFDFSSYLALCGLTNGSLANGDTVVLTCFGFLHPKFIKAVEYYNVNILPSSGFMIDKWMARKDLEDLDLSSVKAILAGGSYVSPEKTKLYNAFFKAHGVKNNIFRGYGMSEAGSAQIIVPPDCEEDILGYPGNKEDFMLKDEADGKFYTLDDGPRTGIMYIATDTSCCNELDGETLFEFTNINGIDFICTNDMVRLNKNGSITYVGRSDKYFANNEGIKFDAGIVETQMSAHPAISMCAVIPVLEKRIHDTVPVFYAVPAEKETDASESIRNAFVDVYIKDKKIVDTNLPVQYIIVDKIPCNSNGKVDVFRLTRERLNGQAYNIQPIRENGDLVDIKTELAEQLNSLTAGTLPEGMGGNSAFNIFDILNASSSQSDNAPQRDFNPLKGITEMFGFKDGQMPQVPDKVMKKTMKLAGRLYGSKDVGHDIDE